MQTSCKGGNNLPPIPHKIRRILRTVTLEEFDQLLQEAEVKGRSGWLSTKWSMGLCLDLM